MLLSRKITTGAMCTALTLVFAGLKYIFPVADFTFLTLSSFCIAIAVILVGIKGGTLTYIASGFLISAIFGILFALPFVLFFGIYPIFKSIIEMRLGKKLLFIFKIILFAGIASVVALLTAVFADKMDINITSVFERFPFLDFLHENRVFVFIIILAGILSVYDLVLSSLILFFTKKVQPNLRKYNS